MPDHVIADFASWIEHGAVDPRDQPASAENTAQAAWKARLEARRQWWSLQQPRQVEPPPVADSAHSQNPVDRFLVEKLNSVQLSQAPPADADTLLRRLSFVLTGLPAPAAQAEAFRKEFARNPDQAVTDLVEELLASPHFGERFARHWMDVIRYTDTYGYEWDVPARGSWEFRDYLIRAFNDDIGFDQLILEQLAGDLLSAHRVNETSGLDESMIGPMFYHMGEHRHGSSLDFNGIHQEMVDNKIDAFSKAFLGLTVACARCHDHKLDAISQADYYALAGVFMTPRWTARPIDSPHRYDNEIHELERLREEIHRGMAEVWMQQVEAGDFQGDRLRQWAIKHPDLFAKSGLEDITYPFSPFLPESRSATTDDTQAALKSKEASRTESVKETWLRLVTEWTTSRHDRQNRNREQFSVLTDFTQPGFPEDWAVDGLGLTHGFVTNGTPVVALDGTALISQLLPQGYHTHALSSKLPGAIRPPEPEQFPRKQVSLKLAGGEWAGRRAVPQNAFMNEGVNGLVFFDPSAPPAWTPIAKVELKNGVTRVLTEVSTVSLNSNFPPPTYLKPKCGTEKLSNTDESSDKRSWLSITGIVAHDVTGSPANELDVFSTLYASETPENEDAVWKNFSFWLTAAICRYGEGIATSGDVDLLNWLLDQKLLVNDIMASPGVGALVERYRQVESQIGFARTVNCMDERGLQPVNYRLNIRGNVDEEGPEVRRSFLEVFEGRHTVDQAEDSGRLALATFLVSAENPLTARVYVNRVWQWVFGTGIVATPNDFGKLGDSPSHPELLDWLTIDFMNSGWSTKHLVRNLVLSQTFRQSGAVSSRGLEIDPDNRLLHHYPTRRLDAEAIRDNMLAASGRLNRQLYGASINPPRPAEDETKRLFSGPLDSDGRRSIYLETSIMDPSRFLRCFNFPDPKMSTGRRDVTNVPAQALTLLNDPLSRELAAHWGQQLIHDGNEHPHERIRSMLLTALRRPPSEEEIHRWTQAISTLTPSTDNLMSNPELWGSLAHALFNTKEFIYFR